MFGRAVLGISALLGACATIPTALPDPAPARAAWAEACPGPHDATEWDKPGPPFRIYGQTYYVGTCGITSLLVVRPEGLTLIDSGTDAGAKTVLANVRALGFDPRKVRTLLMTHEHFDHVGGMAQLQAATGATIYTTGPAAVTLRSGLPNPDDPQAHSGHPPFPSVTGRIERLDVPGAPLTLAGGLRPMFTPGHTLGATSWTWQECERGACKSIVYADSLNPISSDDYRFTDHPGLLKAFRGGLIAVGGAKCDIVLAPHPSAVSLRERLSGAAPLVDPAGCRDYALSVSKRLDKRLADEGAHGG